MPYADYNGFDETYFHMRSVEDPHPAGYSDIDRFPAEDYAERLYDVFDLSQRSICIVGCSKGATVDVLVNKYNVDAWGIDISEWAVDNSVTENITHGDATDEHAFKQARTDAGFDFDLVLSEEMLTCLTDEEAQIACSNMRAIATEMAIHIVWATDGSDVNRDLPARWYNEKTLDEWIRHCDPDHRDRWMTKKEFNSL